MNNKRLIIGSTFLIVLLILLFIIKFPIVQVSYDNSRFYLKEDTFEIGWIHSVEKEPWFETYQLKDHQLFIIGTRFKTFGAGTPSVGKIIPSNDGYVHMELDRKMDEINLVVSKNVKTTLYTENSSIPLYQLVDDHTNVTIEGTEIPLWQIIRGDIYDES